MISLRRLFDISSINDLKTAFRDELTAPIDGMWDQIADVSPHWEIMVDGQRAGYYATDDASTLLQFFVVPRFQKRAQTLFAHVVSNGSISKALVSTGDPLLLALCEGLQMDASLHTYLYELSEEAPAAQQIVDGVTFRLVDESELQQTVAFQQSCLEGGDDLTDWLTSYSRNLIHRNELWCLHLGGDWIGLGECRRSDSQPGIADLGMMVAPNHRGQGWATDILKRLIAGCSEEGLRPICSTTAANAAAQRAITKAGFVSRHRLLEVTFEDPGLASAK